MNNIFVAPKIKVGYQNRSDTYNGKLAYVIYYDNKGKIRKEKSWESWRDKKIEPNEYPNTPIEGFTINKDIKRGNNYEWFSSTRTMVRIHDPRGFEFEITTSNLMSILMHTDCLRKGLIGEFVYAWFGTDLVLLPTSSEEYRNAVKYTEGLDKKVSAKELIPGAVYRTKREGNVTYLGKLDWFYIEHHHKTTSSNRYYPYNRNTSEVYSQKQTKAFVFTQDDGKTFIRKSSISGYLSELVSDTSANYAEVMELFNKTCEAKKLVKVEFVKVPFNGELTGGDTYYKRPVVDHYYLRFADNAYNSVKIYYRYIHGRNNEDTLVAHVYPEATYSITDGNLTVAANGNTQPRELNINGSELYHLKYTFADNTELIVQHPPQYYSDNDFKDVRTTYENTNS